MRRVCRVDRFVIFIIPKFSGQVFEDPSLTSVTRERIQRAAAAGDVDEAEAESMMTLIGQGCRGIGAEIDGRLAGHAWIQFEGEYRFGQCGRMAIPPKHAVAKNLFVFSRFRGHDLGSKLNVARLAMIPAGHTPVGFIIPENRYAIRNWERYGFERVLAWRQSLWFGRARHASITRLGQCSEADALFRALQEANGR